MINYKVVQNSFLIVTIIVIQKLFIALKILNEINLQVQTIYLKHLRYLRYKVKMHSFAYTQVFQDLGEYNAVSRKIPVIVTILKSGSSGKFNSQVTGCSSHILL